MKATKQELLKLDRLKKRSDFLYVRDKGNKWVSTSLILQAAPYETDKILAGFTVTKKLGKAVTRNRIKRRLRSVADEILSVHAKPGMAYVLIGRKDTETLPAQKLRDDLKWCLKRLNCLNEEENAKS